MSWIAAGMAAVGVASSIAGSSAQNKSNGEAFKANADQVYKDYDYQIKQLERQAKDANETIALEMSTKKWEAMKSTASTTNTIAEKNIAGNTAMRQYQQSNINAMFAHNTLAKKAEDTMASFGYEMDNTKVNANNAIYSAAAMAKKANISAIQAGSSAVSAGMAGYSIGRSIGGVSNTSDIMGSEAGGAGGFSSYETASAGGYTGGF